MMTMFLYLVVELIKYNNDEPRDASTIKICSTTL